MAEVYFFTKAEKLLSALDLLQAKDFGGERVPIKLHMGEPGNRCHISPSIVKLTVQKLKEVGAEPFLFDTTVVYPGARATKEGHKRAAAKNGFSEEEIGCQVVIGEEGVQVIAGANSFAVAKEIYGSTHLVVISHVKGHCQTGFGGAIKNLGMGGVTKEAKRMIHHMSVPRRSADRCDLCGSCAQDCPCEAIVVDEEWRYDSVACEGCGKCIPACPNGALTYEDMDLQKGLALAAKACIQGKRVLYVNALVNIARNCDCEPNPGPIICPDIGYLASNELAAMDKASLELVDKVKWRVFEEVTRIDPSKQVRYAEEIGLASSYELREL